MDLAVRASIFKWFSMRVKQVEVKQEEIRKDDWTWEKEKVQEKVRKSSRLNKKK